MDSVDSKCVCTAMIALRKCRYAILFWTTVHSFLIHPNTGPKRGSIEGKTNFTKNRFFRLGASNSFLMQMIKPSKDAPR